jgi:hypothetical protein
VNDIKGIICEPVKEETCSHTAFLLDRTIECMCGQRIESMDVCDLYRITSLIKQVTNRAREHLEEISDLNVVFHVIQLTETVAGIPSDEMTEEDVKLATTEVRNAVAAKLAALEAV